MLDARSTLRFTACFARCWFALSLYWIEFAAMNKWKHTEFKKDLALWSRIPKVRRKARMRALVGGVAVAVLVAVGLLVARPAYHAFQQYRADRNLLRAQAAQSAGQWMVARDRARSVLLVRRGEIVPLRIWFRALRELKDPTAVDGALGLFPHPESTFDDKAQAMEVFAQEAPHAVFLGALSMFKVEDRKHPDILGTTLRFFVGRGQARLALRLWDEADLTSPPPRLYVERVRALCAEGRAEATAEARRIFLGLIGEPGREPLEVMRLLARVPGGLTAGPDFPDLDQWLATRADAEPLDHLYAVHQRMEARPTEARVLVDEAIERFRGPAPVALGTWLVRQGYLGEAIDLLAADSGRNLEAFVSRVDGLIKLGRFDDARNAVAGVPASFDKIKVNAVKAAVETASRNYPATRVALRAALEEARFDNLRNRFFEVAENAFVLGVQDVADDAMVKALCHGRGPIPLHDDVQPLLGRLGRLGRTGDILAISRSLMRNEPNHPALRTNYFYLGCLHGVVTPGEACAELTKLADEWPGRPEILGALAFVRLKTGQAAEAEEALAKAGPTPRISGDFRLAVAGTAAALRGDEVVARDTLGKTNWRNLLAIEGEGFRAILATLKVASLPMPDIRTKGEYQVPTLEEWQSAQKQRHRSFAPKDPGSSTQYPVPDLDEWRKRQQRK